MPDGSLTLFNADPAEAGGAGASVLVRGFRQITFYPEVTALAGGVTAIDWRVQLSFDDATFFDVGVLTPSPLHDVDPGGYRIRYTTGGGAAAVKPSLYMPLNASFLRIFAARTGIPAGSNLRIRAELGQFGAEAPGT